jgi:hypothetical protein
MTDKNSNKKDTKDKPKSCRFCGGTGKVQLRSDDTDILGSKAAERLCPICHGRGKTGTGLRPVKFRFRKLPKKLPVPKGRGGGGRFSRSRHLLPMPGTPLTGYPEGDMVPKSALESAYPYADDRHSVSDYCNTKDGNQEPDEDIDGEPAGNDSVIILRLPDGITISEQFASNLVLNFDLDAMNFQEGLRAGSEPVTAKIVYGAKSDECLEVLLRQINPLHGEPTVLELKSGDRLFDSEAEISTDSKDEVFVFENKDQLPAVEPCSAYIETDISKSHTTSGLEIKNFPAGQLTLSPHQSSNAASMDVLGPAMTSRADPLDVIGIEDTSGFDINTDVAGNTGF